MNDLRLERVAELIEPNSLSKGFNLDTTTIIVFFLDNQIKSMNEIFSKIVLKHVNQVSFNLIHNFGIRFNHSENKTLS